MSNAKLLRPICSSSSLIQALVPCCFARTYCDVEKHAAGVFHALNLRHFRKVIAFSSAQAKVKYHDRSQGGEPVATRESPVVLVQILPVAMEPGHSMEPLWWETWSLITELNGISAVTVLRGGSGLLDNEATRRHAQAVHARAFTFTTTTTTT